MEEFNQESSTQDTSGSVETGSPSESGSVTAETSQSTQSQEGLQAQQPPAPAPLTELEKLEKFMWQGKEWSAKDLRKATMLQSDYTKKTQAMAEERRFIDNLEADLDYVIKNPSLAAQFRSVYPPAYHRYLKYAQAEYAKQEAAKQNYEGEKKKPDSDLIYNPLEDRLNKIEQTFFKQEVEAHRAEIDATFEVMSKKYPLGSEKEVLSAGQFLVDQGQVLDKAAWENLWKLSSQEHEARYKQHYSKTVQEQKTQNQKGKDMAQGGGTPGTPPRQFKTIKEASEAALREAF